MKTGSATNGFIRRPFVMEGILQGIIAGIFSQWTGTALFHTHFTVFHPPSSESSHGLFGRWYFLAGALMGLSVVMGLLGSRWAARKFIKDATLS